MSARNSGDSDDSYEENLIDNDGVQDIGFMGGSVHIENQDAVKEIMRKSERQFEG